MRYLSTRDNYDPVTASQAITLGMVPEGGLFVPESIPAIDPFPAAGSSYQEAARRILSPLLTDFSASDLDLCVTRAYKSAAFDTDSVVEVVSLDDSTSILELWHGPTAAFKDIALQIMPQFLATAKRNCGDVSHTVILVATSGDTGIAALEGFKNCEGVTIIVFYPHEGVSEIQKLQMATTDGDNVHVVAVRGNFDHCQTGVKKLLGSKILRRQFSEKGYRFSSANSINWGRLCPQIVYYWASYHTLVGRSVIRRGEEVTFCIPTGNFGNILAGYYAARMGLPVAKLCCASNKNRVLADFFAGATYDGNRPFYRTMSPSMDILISSNLERFLFEVTGHNAGAVDAWSRSLAETGSFTVDPETKAALDRGIASGWVDEPDVRATIADCYHRTGYILDPHTAVAVALAARTGNGGRHTVIAATASPYKFSRDVLFGMTGESLDDEFMAIDRISALSHVPLHRALKGLRERRIRHTRVIEHNRMRQALLEIMETIV